MGLEAVFPALRGSLLLEQESSDSRKTRIGLFCHCSFIPILVYFLHCICITYRLLRLVLLDQIWSICTCITYRLLRLAPLDQIWSICTCITYRLLRLVLLDQIWSICTCITYRLLRLALLDQIWSICTCITYRLLRLAFWTRYGLFALALLIGY